MQAMFVENMRPVWTLPHSSPNKSCRCEFQSSFVVAPGQGVNKDFFCVFFVGFLSWKIRIPCVGKKRFVLTFHYTDSDWSRMGSIEISINVSLHIQLGRNSSTYLHLISPTFLVARTGVCGGNILIQVATTQFHNLCACITVGSSPKKIW